MSQVFLVIFIVCCLISLIGLIKPNISLFSKSKSRFLAFSIYGSLAIMFFVAYGLALPDIPQVYGNTQVRSVNSPNKYLLTNDQAELLVQNYVQYQSFPVDLVGTSRSASTYEGGITKFDFVPDNAANVKFVVVYPGSLEIQTEERMQVKGNVGIKLADNKKPELISIIADSVEKK